MAEADSHQRPLNLVVDWEGISFGDGESGWFSAVHWFQQIHQHSKSDTSIFSKESLLLQQGSSAVWRDCFCRGDLIIHFVTAACHLRTARRAGRRSLARIVGYRSF
jgi:hypothetical protein